VHSFQTLLQDLHTIVRNTCRTPTGAQDAPTFALTTTPQQTRALALIETISLYPERGTKNTSGFLGETRFLAQQLQVNAPQD